MMMNHTHETSAVTSTGEMLGNTGWTVEAAASMAKEVARENRLFGDRSHRSSRKPARRTRPEPTARELSPAEFTRLTGWTLEDAMAEALELRKERRLFGRTGLYC